MTDNVELYNVVNWLAKQPNSGTALHYEPMHEKILSVMRSLMADTEAAEKRAAEIERRWDRVQEIMARGGE